MSGVIIKDMQMPSTCADCRLMVDGWCYATDADREYGVRQDSLIRRPEWCPLMEIEIED